MKTDIYSYLVLAAELICKLIQALVHLLHYVHYIREDARGIVHTFKPRMYVLLCLRLVLLEIDRLCET